MQPGEAYLANRGYWQRRERPQDTFDLMTKGKDDRDPAPRQGRRKSETAFDQWLSRGLHQMFDDVAKEPIPDELMRLIEADKQP